MSTSDHISLEKIGRCGLITLSRTDALNALTPEMIEAIGEHYRVWIKDHDIYGVVLRSADERAFCAGADICNIYHVGKQNPDRALGLFAAIYQHSWTLELFSKPTISLSNGLTMGGGVGISHYGTHRVGGEAMKWAMPETGIGFFPAIGACYFLSRLPGEIGLYLALTGEMIGPRDAYQLGLLTHTIPSQDFTKIKDAMILSEPIDPVLELLHQELGDAKLERLTPWISSVFSAPSVEEICERLENVTGDAADWAQETVTRIRQQAPLSQKITFRYIREGHKLKTLKEALKVDYRLTSRFLSDPDFYEGIRACLIDKDNTPNWHPKSLEDVSDERVDRYFAPIEKELELQDG